MHALNRFQWRPLHHLRGLRVLHCNVKEVEHVQVFMICQECTPLGTCVDPAYNSKLNSSCGIYQYISVTFSQEIVLPPCRWPKSHMRVVPTFVWAESSECPMLHRARSHRDHASEMLHNDTIFVQCQYCLAGYKASLLLKQQTSHILCPIRLVSQHF